MGHMVVTYALPSGNAYPKDAGPVSTALGLSAVAAKARFIRSECRSGEDSVTTVRSGSIIFMT